MIRLKIPNEKIKASMIHWWMITKTKLTSTFLRLKLKSAWELLIVWEASLGAAERVRRLTRISKFIRNSYLCRNLTAKKYWMSCADKCSFIYGFELGQASDLRLGLAVVLGDVVYLVVAIDVVCFFWAKEVI